MAQTSYPYSILHLSHSPHLPLHQRSSKMHRSPFPSRRHIHRPKRSRSPPNEVLGSSSQESLMIVLGTSRGRCVRLRLRLRERGESDSGSSSRYGTERFVARKMTGAERSWCLVGGVSQYSIAQQGRHCTCRNILYIDILSLGIHIHIHIHIHVHCITFDHLLIRVLLMANTASTRAIRRTNPGLYECSTAR